VDQRPTVIARDAQVPPWPDRTRVSSTALAAAGAVQLRKRVKDALCAKPGMGPAGKEARGSAPASDRAGAGSGQVWAQVVGLFGAVQMGMLKYTSSASFAPAA